jgi:hypothetical protein
LEFYLGKSYAQKFSKPLDEIWDKHDDDGNKFLDRDEAPPFLKEIASLMIDQEKAKNYDPA